MSLQYSNISGASIQTLIPLREVKSATTNLTTVTFDSNIMSSISLCNRHASDAVVVDLYISDIGGDDTYYILKNNSIAFGARLLLEKKEISFSNKILQLKIKLNASDSLLDVIIR